MAYNKLAKNMEKGTLSRLSLIRNIGSNVSSSTPTKCGVTSIKHPLLRNALTCLQTKREDYAIHFSLTMDEMIPSLSQIQPLSSKNKYDLYLQENRRSFLSKSPSRHKHVRLIR